MPFVSLIIPVYNAEKYLRRCLNSAMEQTFQDMEIIVVNDGSQDTSLEICREYEKMDRRFRVINKENTGVSDSRNQAIETARGEYLQFMDSDDWLTPDATESFVHAARKFDCDLVVSDFYRVDGAVFTEKQHIRERGLLTRAQYAEYMMREPADFYYGVLWNKLYRRSIVQEHQLKMDEDLRWCEDFLFNLNFIRYAGRFTAIQTPVYYYMKRKGSLVSTDWKKANAVKLKLRLLKDYKELYQSMDLYEENKLKINAFAVSIAKDGGTDIVSVHPFSSFMESSCIFTDYQRRFDDFISIYDKTCHAAAVLGAEYVVIHGAVAHPKIPIPDERYFDRFNKLIEIGKREGVTVCQENVNRFKSESIDFCKKMRAALGDDFHMVFDIKQTVRAGQNTFEFLEEFKNQIVHMHISDNNAQRDCLPPGKGTFDYNKMKNILESANYQGVYMTEIYSLGFDVEKELRESKAYLETI